MSTDNKSLNLDIFNPDGSPFLRHSLPLESGADIFSAASVHANIIKTFASGSDEELSSMVKDLNIKVFMPTCEDVVPEPGTILH